MSLIFRGDCVIYLPQPFYLVAIILHFAPQEVHERGGREEAGSVLPDEKTCPAHHLPVDKNERLGSQSRCQHIADIYTAVLHICRSQNFCHVVVFIPCTHSISITAPSSSPFIVRLSKRFIKNLQDEMKKGPGPH